MGQLGYGLLHRKACTEGDAAYFAARCVGVNDAVGFDAHLHDMVPARRGPGKIRLNIGAIRCGERCYALPVCVVSRIAHLAVDVHRLAYSPGSDVDVGVLVDLIPARVGGVLGYGLLLIAKNFTNCNHTFSR